MCRPIRYSLVSQHVEKVTK